MSAYRPGDHQERYSRQTALPGFGEQGQQALAECAALICGLGGTGTAAARYLAGAGAGCIGLADIDKVERSNLHRQILYHESDIGAPKTEAALRALRRIAPHLEYRLYNAADDPAPLLQAIASYDVILDCTDSFPVRAELHRAAFAARVPLIHCAAEGYAGYVTVFRGYYPCEPCLHCFMPDPPDDPALRGCAGAGVLGPAPGIAGAAAAAEALKLLTGTGAPLSGRIQFFDLLKARTRETALRKNPGCRHCGGVFARYPGK